MPALFPFAQDIDDNHPSETAMDDYLDFDFTIHNTGSFQDLERQVRELLTRL